MSSELYPISLIESLVSEPVNRVIADQFEDGSTSTRLAWAAQYFKRRLRIVHSPLTETEFRYLRSFYSQRSGEYDSFWFRDNVRRDGNLLVRFAGSVPRQFMGRARRLQVALEEVEPIRALPEWDELTTAAGSAPLFWFDANREIYYKHKGTAYSGEANAWDSMLAYPAAWQGVSLPLGGTASQYQHYAFTGSEYARTGALVISGTKPAATVFCIAKHGTVSSKEVLFGVGTMGSGKALGIAVSASNAYEPWIGGSETWGTATQSNGTNNTWRSFAVTWAASSDTAKFYVNGAAALSESETRAFDDNIGTLGAAVDGTLKCTGNVAHAMVFNGELSHAQVKAIHNLLGYQYGLSTV